MQTTFRVEGLGTRFLKGSNIIGEYSIIGVTKGDTWVLHCVSHGKVEGVGSWGK